MSGRRRARLTDLAIGLASLLLLASVIVGYVEHAFGDGDQFANRATASLRDDDVRDLVAERVTDGLVLQRSADLTAARPLVLDLTGALVGSRAFTGLFRAAVGDLHRAVFTDGQGTVTLTVLDAGTLVGAALERVRPGLGTELQKRRPTELAGGDIGGLTGSAARILQRAAVLGWLLAALTVVAVLIIVGTARDRRRVIGRLGVGVALAGVALLVTLAVLRSVVVGEIGGQAERAAARGVWDAFLGDLRALGWLLAGSGAVIAAAAASLLRPASLGDPVRRLGAVLAREPERPFVRGARGVGLVLAGIILLLARDAVLALLLALSGAYLIYEGVAILLRLSAAPRAGAVESRHRAPRHRAPRHRAPRRRVLLPALGLVALLAVGIGTFTATGGTSTAAPDTGACNGHRELCERRLDEVSLPATHNSMSAPLPGWFSAEQERPIPGQLEDGIRGLLIDTHYADKLENGRYRTVLEGPVDPAGDGLSDEQVAAARRTRGRLGFKGKGERGIYLCHGFCELGATPLTEVLGQLRTFLVTHPDEVVVLVNQDEITPEDFVAAIREAGLEQLAYRGPLEGELPTLREMIDAGQRLVLLAEKEAGVAPWYRPVYAGAVQETPFRFTKVQQLTDPKGRQASCAANRGGRKAPLFLLNHWVSTDPVPLPSQATVVNARGPLLARARACERLRGRLPNLVAVNFYKRGDLFGVVDELNGLDR